VDPRRPAGTAMMGERTLYGGDSMATSGTKISSISTGWLPAHPVLQTRHVDETAKTRIGMDKEITGAAARAEGCLSMLEQENRGTSVIPFQLRAPRWRWDRRYDGA